MPEMNSLGVISDSSSVTTTKCVTASGIKKSPYASCCSSRTESGSSEPTSSSMNR